jgi:hypothetical protein
MPALSDAQLAQFVTDGFVRIDNAFPAILADAGRAILWADTGLDPNDPGTWTKPVIRLGNYGQPPFRDAANTPLRFPSPDDPGDAGWHVDVSFGWEENPTDFMAWRANITSRGRALLMLFLLSEVGEKDAPTRIRVGSHLGIARRLAPAGEAGLSLRELASTGFSESEDCPEVLATGSPGTVYLCHPFLVHSAQPHHGTRPRFMAQPPLLPREPLRLEREDGAYSPVEQAIRHALA